MDACLIAAGQRAEHYEMAAYGTLVGWAPAMGHSEAAGFLQQTLDEEKAADEKLSGLAESGINQGAAEALTRTRLRKNPPPLAVPRMRRRARSRPGGDTRHRRSERPLEGQRRSRSEAPR
jgi:Domain of unknown function (DUF892)